MGTGGAEVKETDEAPGLLCRLLGETDSTRKHGCFPIVRRPF